MKYLKLYHLSVKSLISIEFSFILFLLANVLSNNIILSTLVYAVSLIIFSFSSEIKGVSLGWLILLIFSFSYVFFEIGFNYGSFFSLRYLFFIPFAYLLGVKVADVSKNEKNIISILFLIASSLLFISFFEIIQDTIEVGIINKNRLFDINGAAKATVIGITKSLSIGLGVGLIFVLNECGISKGNKWLLFISFLYALYVNIHLLNRTGLAIFFIIVLFLLVKNMKVKTFISLLIVISIFAFMYLKLGANKEITTIIEAYQSRANNAGSLNGRGELWATSIKHLTTDIGGWYLNSSGETNRFAHNLWLDIARCSGIVSFFLFIAFTITTIVDFCKLIFSQYISKSVKTILWAIYLSIILQCNVEPILEASLSYFMTIIFIFGFIYKLNLNTKCV